MLLLDSYHDQPKVHCETMLMYKKMYLIQTKYVIKCISNYSLFIQ